MGQGEPLALLKRAAAGQGVRAWVVGGYVRDLLLGRERPDLDVVVEGDSLALAGEFARLAGAPPPQLFERFGTAQVKAGDLKVEFARTRAESYEPESRKPQVRPATIEEDLRRRDFTVNALLMDFGGEILDPLGSGRRDLEARLLRTPSDPLRTFGDDPLRMLRAIRLAVELGFELDPPLLPAMRRLKDRLRPPVLSVERTADELRKMLVSPDPKRALELLDAGSLLEVVLPELVACKDVRQGGYHTHDVFGHTLLTVAATPPDLVTRLAAVFHDTGKPLRATPEGSFLGHEVVGAELTLAALERLRFSRSDAERTARLVRMHLRPVYYESEWTDGAVRKLARDAGDDLGRLLELARADLAASAYDRPEKLDELARRLEAVLGEQPTRMRLPITGEDVMQVLALPPGPAVGRALRRLDELVLEGGLPPDRDALLEHLRRHPELAD